MSLFHSHAHQFHKCEKWLKRFRSIFSCRPKFRFYFIFFQAQSNSYDGLMNWSCSVILLTKTTWTAQVNFQRDFNVSKKQTEMKSTFHCNSPANGLSLKKHNARSIHLINPSNGCANDQRSTLMAKQTNCKILGIPNDFHCDVYRFSRTMNFLKEYN